MDGKTTPTQKQRVVDMFQERDAIKIILGQMLPLVKRATRQFISRRLVIGPMIEFAHYEKPVLRIQHDPASTDVVRSLRGIAHHL